MINVFIDGKEGTCGLEIFDRLSDRPDVAVEVLDEDKRKDEKARSEMLNDSDVCFLCLPDEAAAESVSLVKNPSTKIIDASCAHRTDPGWVYGLPEKSEERYGEIANSKRVSNPGCHATGFICLVAPLIYGGIVERDYPFVATSVSGYSGAGRKAIEQYRKDDRDPSLGSPRHYSHTQMHKHLPEMVRECELSREPLFTPLICDYYSGMCVSVPIYSDLMSKKYTARDFRKYYAEYYARYKYIEIPEEDEIPGYIAANELSGTNRLKIYVSGNSERIFLASVFDNLGKGASGAAVQNMNIMFGLDMYAHLK